MTLVELLEKLDELSDNLVDAENAITPNGDMPEFTQLQRQLGDMRQIVVDMINERLES